MTTYLYQIPLSKIQREFIQNELPKLKNLRSTSEETILLSDRDFDSLRHYLWEKYGQPDYTYLRLPNFKDFDNPYKLFPINSPSPEITELIYKLEESLNNSITGSTNNFDGNNNINLKEVKYIDTDLPSPRVKE